MKCPTTLVHSHNVTPFLPPSFPPSPPPSSLRLQDSEPLVRKNTLIVLTHLVLNDMIKVKGQISEVALVLEDSDKSISDRARLFFSQLAKKVSFIPKEAQCTCTV